MSLAAAGAVVAGLLFLIYPLCWPERASRSDDLIGAVLPTVLIPLGAVAGSIIGGTIERRRRARQKLMAAGDVVKVTAPAWVEEPSEPHLAVRYELEEEDVCWFSLYHARKEQGRGFLAVYVVLLIAVFVISVQGLPVIAGIPALLISAVLLPFGFRSVLREQALKWARQTPGTLGDNARILTPEGVRAWSPVWGEALTNWQAAVRIVDTPDYILFYRNQNMADIIPIRAFATREAADTFLQIAREWHAAATDSAPVGTAS
jgi:hypothetical protein